MYFSHISIGGGITGLETIISTFTKIKDELHKSQNLNKALSVFKTYGKLDLGQSLVVQNQIVLGLEAAEGTDNLILRCKNLKKKWR